MRFIAKTLYGLEEVLALELQQLGAQNVKAANRAVFFTGGLEMMYMANYCSRTALSILRPISEFYIGSKDDLYKECSKIPWSDFMDSDSSFSVVPVVNSKIFEHTGFPALVVKDAIVDYFREKMGRRPSVDTHNPSIVINVHISNTRATVSLDSTVIPLYKRGYKSEHGDAPLNEALAAGMLYLSGWDKKSYLFDPMCGSGTIIIEAALMAANVPPGKFRESFGFTRWKDYDENLFNSIKEAEEAKIDKTGLKISGSDISGIAVKNAVENIANAGLSDVIDVKMADIKDFSTNGERGVVIMNPPYGQRIVPEEIEELYGTIGTVLKHKCPGNKAWIITSEKIFLNKIGLKPFAKHILYNGSIECLFVGYELYEGSKKGEKRGSDQ